MLMVHTVGFEGLRTMVSTTCKREDSSCSKTSVTLLMMLFCTESSQRLESCALIWSEGIAVIHLNIS